MPPKDRRALRSQLSESRGENQGSEDSANTGKGKGSGKSSGKGQGKGKGKGKGGGKGSGKGKGKGTGDNSSSNKWTATDDELKVESLRTVASNPKESANENGAKPDKVEMSSKAPSSSSSPIRTLPEPEPEQAAKQSPNGSEEKPKGKVNPAEIADIKDRSKCSGFMHQLAWQPHFVPCSTYRVIAKHCTLPVTILHDDDKMSLRWVKEVQELLGAASHVVLKPYSFSSGFGFKDLLQQSCILTFVRCQADGLAHDMKLRHLVSDLQEEALRRTAMLGKLRASALGSLAFAVVGLGPREKFCVSKRGDPFCQAAKAVDEAFEDLSGVRLLKSRWIDEATEDVPAQLERFTVEAVKTIEAFSKGTWVHVEEQYTGYKWSIDEVQLELHLQSRKGMQDG